MCGLCGIFESGRAWMDAATKLDAAAARRERLKKLAVLRRVLAQHRVTVDDFAGTRFVLRGPTGATEIVDNFFDLWKKAERLSKRRIDPLDTAGGTRA